MAKKKKQDVSILNDLLIRLAEDPKLLSAYMKCPDGVMLGAGVPEDQIKIVLTGKQSDIESMLGDGHIGIKIIVLPKC